MESTSIAMKVQISQTTRSLLPDNYRVTERDDIEVKGKGSMKTYWLDDRDNRQSISIAQSKPSPVKAIEYNQDRRMSMPQYMLYNKNESSADDRRVYSPITFEDVARRSIVNSPIRSLFSGHGRVSRSNSTGHAYMQSPSDVFGSLITDTEEFLEDLQSRNSAGSSFYSPLSTPLTGFRSAKLRSKKQAAGKVGWLKLYKVL